MVRASVTATIPATIRIASGSANSHCNSACKGQHSPEFATNACILRRPITKSPQHPLLGGDSEPRRAHPVVAFKAEGESDGFCRSINICASLYKMFIPELQEESYEPLGSTPNISNRLFAMYHTRIAEDEKQQIMGSIMTPAGNCRVLFCTTAFGMGVDVSNIRTVIHFGPTADVDDYFQESGRAGRDGIESSAILY